MIIGVMSDMHGDKYAVRKASEKFQNADLVINLGDYIDDADYLAQYYNGRIISVKGNCDFSHKAPVDRIEKIENKVFFITHGQRYGVKYSLSDLKWKAKEVKADIVLYGHTHISKIDYEDGIFFLNPGSGSYSRRDFNSVAIVEINEKGINPSILRI